MQMPVKYTSRFSAKVWLLYFLATIGLVGATLAYGFAAPLYLLGLAWKPASKAADRVIVWGIGWLMRIQPWLSADIQISVVDPRVRTTGVLMVSNHRSHLDSFILLSQVQGIRILAKRTLFYVPFLGMMMRMTRQIPARRGQLDSFWKAIELIRLRLRQGDVVHVFPEMTRCSPGFTGTANFSIAPFLTAIQERVPVIPVVFTGTDAVWPKGSFGLNFRRPVTAKALAPIDSAGYTSAEALRDETRRRINEALLA